MNCGPKCLKIISDYYNKENTLEEIEENFVMQKDGASAYHLLQAAKKIGFRTVAVEVSFEIAAKELPTPFIAFWNAMHYVVVLGFTDSSVHINDPSIGDLMVSRESFQYSWLYPNAPNDKAKGVLILFKENEGNC